MTYTPEQQKANRKLWIEVLESGEYEHGKSFLNNHGKFCCLGVLCEVAIKSGVGVEKQDGEHPTRYHWEVSGAPKQVMDFVGLRETLGTYKNGALYELNDFRGKNFKQIAEVIRSEPEGLFVGAQS